MGDLSRNTTVYGPVAETPDVSKKGERPAFDPFAPTYCFMLATTSAAVSVLPLWNFTPLRIWNVHTVASAFGFQLVASHGRILPCGSVNVRYSPGMPASASAPPSLSRYGSSDPPPVSPTRSVPPAWTRANPAAASRSKRLPHRQDRGGCPSRQPRGRTSRPRRRNSVRSISPLTSSSIRLFSSGPASLRR